MRCGPGTTEMAFDVTDPRAVAWAQAHAAELIANITADAKAAIRALIADGLEHGVSVRDTAKLIRSTIGLTPRDAQAVTKRRLALIKRGVANDVATARAERYAAKLLKARAEMISRTETMRAANEGQAELWHQAEEQGFLSGKENKIWLTADPCPKCAPLDGEIVGINESFSVGQDPPLHPRCKCTIGLTFQPKTRL